MTVDLAKLGIEVDSSDAVKASTDLDKLRKSADGAEDSTKRLSRTGSILSSTFGKMASFVGGLAAGIASFQTVMAAFSQAREFNSAMSETQTLIRGTAQEMAFLEEQTRSSKAPPVPGFLKDGTPSLKRMRTLPTALTQFIRSAGLKPKDYEDFIREARSNRSDWFTRQYTPVDNEVKDLVFKEFLDTIDDMVEGHGKKQTMNIERHCAWCEFEKLCRAKLQGLDYDFVKEREYEKAIKPKDDSEKIPHRIQFGD